MTRKIEEKRRFMLKNLIKMIKKENLELKIKIVKNMRLFVQDIR